MVANMDDFQDINETFKDFVTPDTCPARSFFQVFKLPKNALVMIDAVAFVPGSEAYAEVALPKNALVMIDAVEKMDARQACNSCFFCGQALLVNNQTLYVSGQIGMEPGKTELVPGGARAEAKQAMTNIGELLQAG
ncbi:hypothetical protein niasHT_038462 [Heterodera trifolii]|uniref:Uncharacterized protein n=1 Tax=Heterodera trifolii TaxID=157864 RepID=A0ABD2IT40_9BILA